MRKVIHESKPNSSWKIWLTLVGVTLSFLGDSNFIEKRQNRYGDLFKTHIFGRPTIIFIGTQANRFLFAKENQYFAATWPYSTRVLLGPASLAMQSGEIHRSRRKIIAQAFQPRALAGYVPAMKAITRRYLQKWENMGTLTWYPEMRQYTFDIACKLLVGIDGATETNLRDWFEEWCNGLFTVPLGLPGTKFSRALKCRQKLLDRIEAIIEERSKQKQSHPEDALGLLLQARDEDGTPLKVEEIKEQILNLLFAGHETLTSSLTSLCLKLAQYPHIKEKAKTEQDKLALEDNLTLDNLKQMTYLDQVMKEVLRVVPPVGGGFREVIQTCEFQGYQLPKGWCVFYQIGRTHLDEQVYSHPQYFDPERFGPQREKDKPPFSHIPFGGGMRECLGKEFARLEIKLLAAELVQNYEWELLPNQDLQMTTIPTPRPRDGLRVNFHRR
ncbi:MAG: cytochrome P450 [Prochloron sp. SP5CPC1]|nr:cytochrome P450 [Candidatus Paraprochloron terpiosi SP5CPC1]